MAHYDYSRGFADRAAVSLGSPGLREAVAGASDRQMRNREAALTSLRDPNGLRDLASDIRSAALSRLDEHLERLAEGWEAAGGTVFFAGDAQEASSYVRRVAEASDAELVVKSKSMASEEIGVNRVLQEAGMEVVETDLGEYIIQLAGEHPSHIITPAIHRTKEDVADLFSRHAGRRMPAEATELASYAREILRGRFLRADVGISGVNFGISEKGAICLVTNEGNGRMCTTLPPVHIAIMGMERVVGTFDELAVMLALLGRSATGQKLTQYTSIIRGPRRPGEADGPEASHLLILDNGRSDVLGTRYEEALKCIRCGACLNVCPVYRPLGGHAYDPVYSGPIGAVLGPLLNPDGHGAELPHASTLCGACTEACPVGIPLDDLLLHLRQGYAVSRASTLERVSFGAWSRAWSTSRRFRFFGRLGVLLGRLTRRRPIRRMRLPVLSRWTRGRRLPPFPRRLFRDGRD